MKFAVDLSKGVLGEADSTELWTEITSHIPDSVLLTPGVKILSVACGHCTEAVIVAKRMIALGVSKEAARESIWLIDKYKQFTNPAKKVYGFTNVVTADFLEWDPGMKFDVVVGNPPYQDSLAKSSKKLWPEFFKKTMSLLNDNGILGMITPSSWMAGKSEIFEFFKKYQCSVLTTDASAHFPRVGSTFCWYVFQKKSISSPTKLLPSGTIDFRKVSFIPRDVNQLSLSVYEKLKGPKLQVKFDSFCHSQRVDRVSASKVGFYRYAIKHGAESILWSNVPHPAQTDKKVMFYMSGNPKPFFDDGTYGISEHHAYIPAKDEAEAANISAYLKSKIIKFVISNSTFAQAWNKEFLKKIPSVDFSKPWTDADLYKHFSLTQEEIDYVEANTK